MEQGHQLWTKPFLERFFGNTMNCWKFWRPSWNLDCCQYHLLYQCWLLETSSPSSLVGNPTMAEDSCPNISIINLLLQSPLLHVCYLESEPVFAEILKAKCTNRLIMHKSRILPGMVTSSIFMHLDICILTQTLNRLEKLLCIDLQLENFISLHKLFLWKLLRRIVGYN